MMIIIEEKEALEKLTMPVCIDLMEKALSDLAAGKCFQPMRTVLTIPGNNSFGFMPAHLGDYFGAKIITAFHANLGTKYPSHMGYVMIFDAEHGTPVSAQELAPVYLRISQAERERNARLKREAQA